jgi:hypothetical protein
VQVVEMLKMMKCDSFGDPLRDINTNVARLLVENLKSREVPVYYKTYQTRKSFL